MTSETKQKLKQIHDEINRKELRRDKKLNSVFQYFGNVDIEKSYMDLIEFLLIHYIDCQVLVDGHVAYTEGKITLSEFKEYFFLIASNK